MESEMSRFVNLVDIFVAGQYIIILTDPQKVDE